METNRTKKAQNYNAKLYETCQYMIQNSEQFKDYAIYKNRISLGGDNEFMDLHNCLIDSFNFLTGKSKKRSNKEWAKGSQVMASLNLEDLPTEKLAILLSIFYEYTWENHKSKSQLFKINVEKKSLLINTLIEKLNHDYVCSIKEIINDLRMQSERESIEETDYASALDIVYNIYKTELINDCKRSMAEGNPAKYTLFQSEMNFYDMALLRDDTPSYLKVSKNMRSLEKRYPQFGNLKDSYYTWLYADLFCHELLGTITFLLTNKESDFSLKELENLNGIVLELIQEYPVQSIETIGSMEEILYYFSSYYNIRDKFLQDTNILKYITDNCGNRENPKPEYTISIPTDLTRDFSMNEIKELFTEGEETKNETFRKNYDSCKSGIDKYNKKTRRNISNNLITQKVMYREIFTDSTVYEKNRHTSKNIFLNFLRNGTMKSSDYYFLNEKINMGMYREFGLIDEFYAKNEFQENFYHLISLILSRLYPDKILSVLEKCLFKIWRELVIISKKKHLNYNLSEILEMQALAMILEDEYAISFSDIGFPN